MPAPTTRLVFLGTGASGGTPGRGRSRRRESSLLLDGRVRVLLDVTRDASVQLKGVGRIDAVLLTHAHRDATGGIPALRGRRDARPLPVLAHAKTLATLERRYARLDHCMLVPITPGRPRSVGPWTVSAIAVPHAADETPTLAWKVVTDDGTVVYASDVARRTPWLARFAAGAHVLVVDGATYGRTIFTHLRIDRDLPSICVWDVERIFLTQIGRSAPSHDRLQRVVGALCPRARPAYDGLTVDLAVTGVSGEGVTRSSSVADAGHDRELSGRALDPHRGPA